MRFDEKVWALVAQIPEGRVCAYGDVAAAMGSPRVARQVGFALARLDVNARPEVPWQRVINAAGRISGRGDTIRAELQEQLLREEGIAFDDSGRCDLRRLRFMEFEPLA